MFWWLYLYMFPPTATPRLPLSATPFAARATLRPGSEMDIFRIDEGVILRPAQEAEKWAFGRRNNAGFNRMEYGI